jgi:hypothetical protein
VTENQPPDWGSADSFSRYFRDAELNDRATAAKYPAVFAFLQRVHATFETAESAVEKDDGAARVVPRFLFVRVHAAYLRACRLGMSGQVSEAHAVLRAGLEQAWYALHIAKDPDPLARAEVWLRRNESPEALNSCKADFTVRNVRKTHEALDAATAADLKALYDDVIDFGAHPNQLGVLAAVRSTREQDRVDYKVGVLYPEQAPVLFTLRLATAIAIGALKLFRLVYPERFALVGLDGELDKLIKQRSAVFKPYAGAAK